MVVIVITIIISIIVIILIAIIISTIILLNLPEIEPPVIIMQSFHLTQANH